MALAAITDHDEMYRLATLSQVALPRLLAALRALAARLTELRQDEQHRTGGSGAVMDTLQYCENEIRALLTDLDLGADR